ncbi:uncharacterized protein LOC143188296 [Calliopsis andreniformis]|uniref:uncharacterized protein LOC143188296 n=1 Tax=Calliopsis andreniformis TaxID=337506 RepID=UPI003FCDDD73
MISQTEELVVAAPPGAEKKPKQDSKPRRLSARTFDFFRRGDSRRENAVRKEENQQRREDLVKLRIVDCKTNNTLPTKTSFNFFKNIKKHMQIRKLAIRKSKRRTEAQESSSQDDTNCDSSVLHNDKSVTCVEDNNALESSYEGATETSIDLSGNETPVKATAEEVFSQSDYVLENQESILEDYSGKTTERVSNLSIEESYRENNFENIPNTYQSSFNNPQLGHDVRVESRERNHHIENIQGNVENNEAINNDNKVKASLTEELLKLSNYGWYWGPISGNEADAKLISEPDGAFLVRDSSDARYVLTLSFKSSGKLLHARMEHSGGLFSLCNQNENEGFSSVADLIDYSMNFSQSAVFCYSRPRYPGQPSFPVRLTKPVSRFTQVRSLQYLCRFVIRQNTRLDNIHKLPLPKTIKGYIEEAHY